MTTRRIVIVGGGFAGVRCARSLRRRRRPPEWEIVLFNSENHMVFHPMLAEVAGGSLNPDCVAAPLRQMLPGVWCRTEEVVGVDLDQNRVVFLGHDGRRESLVYDHVILACGAVVNLGMVPGMADHAFPLKTVGDAVALRAHVMQQLERAEICDDEETRRWYLSFVVVGGGYSGVEAAGEINDLARGSCRFYRNVRPEDIRVTILHSRPQLLPEIGDRLREFTRVQMERAGIRVLLETRCSMATQRGVGLDDGSVLEAGTVVCTIGTSPSPVVLALDSPLDRGRVVTESDMRLPGRENAWAIGDCARVVNSKSGEPSPPTGQFAERQGRQCAANLERVVRGEATRPFAFEPLGQLCAIGGHSAVAEILGLRVAGFLAWFLWRTIYLFKMPSWARRAKVGFDWAWQLVFSRDLSHLRADRTSRVSRAHYWAGDFVFREGDPASDFYVVEKGEALVLRERDDASGELEELAVLGPGDFFGEMALLTNEPRNASIRARTDLEVVVMGRHVFEQVSGALKPLEDLLTLAMTRRRGSHWALAPEARRVLEESTVEQFLEEAPAAPLTADTPFAEVVRTFRDLRLDFACVLDEEGALVGVLDRSDFLQAMDAELHAATPVSSILDDELVSVASSDSAALAADTMREHGRDWLPVVGAPGSRRLLGVIRTHAMIARVL